MKSRVFKIAVSLLLSVMILCFSFSVYAVDGTPPPQSDNPLLEANDQTAAFLVWQLLKTWGIDIQFQDISEFTTEIQTFIMNEILEFLGDQPSVESVISWIAGWRYGTDFWGNLVVNQTLLEDVQDFADWLVDKFGLYNDDTIVVNPVFSVGGYQLYNFNTYYPCEWSDGSSYDGYFNLSYDITSGSVRPIGYFFARYYMPSLDMYNTVLYSVASEVNGIGSTMYKLNLIESDGDIYTDRTGYFISQGYWSRSSQGYYYVNSPSPIMKPGASGVMLWVPGDNVTDLTQQEFNSQFLPNITVEQDGDINIVTATIVTPSLDPNYTPGDSLTIIDGEPDYSVVDWDGSVTVSNLPAIISTNQLDDPEIDQIYTNIPPLVEEATGSMEIMRQIIFRMPDEVLIALYALLSAGVIFGFLRIMREH